MEIKFTYSASQMNLTEEALKKVLGIFARNAQTVDAEMDIS